MAQDYKTEGRWHNLWLFAVCGEDRADTTWHRAAVSYRQGEGGSIRRLRWRSDEHGPFGASAMDDLEAHLEVVRWSVLQEPVSDGPYRDPNWSTVIWAGEPRTTVVDAPDHPLAGGALALLEFLTLYPELDPPTFLAERRPAVDERLREMPHALPVR